MDQILVLQNSDRFQFFLDHAATSNLPVHWQSATQPQGPMPGLAIPGPSHFRSQL